MDKTIESDTIENFLISVGFFKLYNHINFSCKRRDPILITKIKAIDLVAVLVRPLPFINRFQMVSCNKIILIDHSGFIFSINLEGY